MATAQLSNLRSDRQMQAGTALIRGCGRASWWVRACCKGKPCLNLAVARTQQNGTKQPNWHTADA